MKDASSECYYTDGVAVSKEDIQKRILLWTTVFTKDKGILELSRQEWFNFNFKNLHRLDGPAVKYYDGTVLYYIDGENLYKEEFDTIINEMESLGSALGLTDSRWWVRDHWKRKLNE